MVAHPLLSRGGTVRFRSFGHKESLLKVRSVKKQEQTKGLRVNYKVVGCWELMQSTPAPIGASPVAQKIIQIKSIHRRGRPLSVTALGGSGGVYPKCHPPRE